MTFVVGQAVRVWPRPGDAAPKGTVLIATIREVSKTREVMVVVFRNHATRRITFDEIESIV